MCITLGGGAVVWRSIKQSSITDLTMEAEYIAACEAIVGRGFKKYIFSEQYGKQNSGSVGTGILKIFQNTFECSLGFIHIYFYGKNQIHKLIIKCKIVTLTLL